MTLYTNPDGTECCGGPNWRGRHCQYHQGFEDGYEKGHLDGKLEKGHMPYRGSEVEKYIKAARDEYDQYDTGVDGSTDAAKWMALDDLLDDYRLRADTGSSLRALPEALQT